MKKTVIINIIVIVCLLLAAEFAAFLYVFINSNSDTHLRNFQTYIPKRGPFDKLYKDLQLRPAEGLEYNRRPVVIFGCSYAYGAYLENNQTFSHKLSALTKRPVYNRAYNAWGVQHMLWQLQNEPALAQIKNPEYVIYVFINDHMRRLINDSLWGTVINPVYVEKDGRLGLKAHPFRPLYNLYSVNYLSEKYGNKLFCDCGKNPKKAEKLGGLVKLHFREAKEFVNEKYPDAKFVIIKFFNRFSGEVTDFGLDYIWDDLAREGFIILDPNELTGKDLSQTQYHISETDTHPNEAAWDVLVPALAKRPGIK